MKEYMVCLSHFCEIHGPTSVICTERFSSTNPAPTNGSTNHPETGGSSSAHHSSSGATCLSCQMLLPTDSSESGVIRSVDEENNSTTYVSQQYPASQTRYKVLRQIVMKCLSVETTYDDMKPIMFGDSSLGFAIAMSFKIKDNTARGSERKYALIVLSEDETQLMKAWELIVISLTSFIKFVKNRITELEAKEVGDANNNERFYRRILPKPKSLIELLADEKFFIKIHLWASNLLRHLNA